MSDYQVSYQKTGVFVVAICENMESNPIVLYVYIDGVRGDNNIIVKSLVWPFTAAVAGASSHRETASAGNL
jgi:hypothetical protein